MLGFQRLSADFQIASLWNRAFTFREAAVDAPQVRAVIRPDGALNLADLALPSEPAAPAVPPPRVWIQKLEIGRGSVTFVDKARRKPFEQHFGDVGFQSRTSAPRPKAATSASVHAAERARPSNGRAALLRHR
jgi:hypothetical protein